MNLPLMTILLVHQVCQISIHQTQILRVKLIVRAVRSHQERKIIQRMTMSMKKTRRKKRARAFDSEDGSDNEKIRRKKKRN